MKKLFFLLIIYTMTFQCSFAALFQTEIVKMQHFLNKYPATCVFDADILDETEDVFNNFIFENETLTEFGNFTDETDCKLVQKKEKVKKSSKSEVKKQKADLKEKQEPVVEEKFSASTEKTKENKDKKKQDEKAVEKQENFEQMFEDAVCLYNLNKVEEAKQILSSIENKNAAVFLLLANIAEDLGNIDEAIANCQKSISEDPKFYKAYYNLGNLLVKKNNPDLAFQYFKKACSLNKKFPYAQYNLGNCYLEKQEYKKAVKCYQKAIFLKQTEPDFYYNLAYCYNKMNDKKKCEKFLQYYNQCLNLQNN